MLVYFDSIKGGVKTLNYEKQNKTYYFKMTHEINHYHVYHVEDGLYELACYYDNTLIVKLYFSKKIKKVNFQNVYIKVVTE